MNVLLVLLFMKIKIMVVFLFLKINAKVLSFFFFFFFFFFFLKPINNKKIACNFPCFGCNGSGTNNCTKCVDNYSLNDTTCIPNDQCLLNGYIDNGICQGFFFIC